MKGESVRFITALRPLSLDKDRLDITVPAGGTVATLLRASHIDPDPLWARVFIDGQFVDKACWDSVVPMAGQCVTVRAIPMGGEGGGGKMAMRIIAMLAVVALAIAAPYAAPVAWGLVGGWSGAALSASVMLAGTLAVNALIPPPKPRLDALSGSQSGTTTSPTLSLTGASNKLAPYAPIPRVYGRHRLFPPLAARPYTEIEGNNQYLRLLFCCGYGPLELTDFAIGETPLDQYTDVQTEIRYGYSDDPALTLFTDDMYEDAQSVLLTQAGGATTRTSQPLADELSLDLTFPQGLATFDQSGNPGSRSVQFLVEYRAVGSGGEQLAEISWAANAEPDLAGYKIYHGTSSGVYHESVDVGNVLTYVWSGLPYGANYFAVTAYDTSANESGLSAEVVKVISGVDWTAISSLAAAAASAVIGSAGANNDLTLTARTAGYDGNNISYRFVSDDGDTIRVIGTIIEINMLGSSAQAIQTAIDGTPESSALISVTVEGTGAGLVNPASPTGYLTGGREAVSSLTVTDNRATLIRTSWRWAVPQGQYDVRVTRVTADATDSLVRDQAYWTLLRTITHRPPVTKPGLAWVAMRIKATDQLNGSVDQFNCIARSILRDWTGTGWIPQPTSNPASIYRDIVQGSANRSALADSRVDVAGLQAWHARCVTAGYEFNGVIDYRTSVFELLRDVAAVGRATYGQRDGKHGVIEDVFQDTPVTVLTPRNSWGFRGTKVFADLPHALVVRFVNPDQDWQQDERYVYDDGYNADGSSGLTAASKFETMDLFGVTSAAQAWKMGRYHLAVAKLRPETYALSVDFEQLIMTRGDLVRVVHDVPLFGLGSARVLDYTLNSSGSITALDIDEVLTMEAGQTYGLRFRHADGTQEVVTLATVPGEQTTLTLVDPMAVTRPVATDLSGNNDHGTYTGGVHLGHPGILYENVGASPLFSSALTSAVTISNVNALGTAITLEIWWKPTVLADQIAFGTFTTAYLRRSGTGQVRFSFRDGTNTQRIYTAPGTPMAANDTLYHVVATHDGTWARIYLNGIEIYSANTWSLQSVPLGGWTVGRFAGGGFHVDGYLAHAACYASALSPSRIYARYAAASASHTNLLLQSENLAATWINVRSSESSNALAGPFTSQLVAWKLIEDTTASSSHYLYQNNVAVTQGQPYTFSVYAKAGERTRLRLQVQGGVLQTDVYRATFDLSNGTIIPVAGAGAAILLNSAIEDAGGGWYRCRVTGLITNEAVVDTLFVLLNGSASSYSGDGTSGLYLYGPQLEAGTAPTRYIPTIASPVTLSAEDYAAVVLADAPVGYWPLAEFQTPDVGDLVAYGLAGQESVELVVKDIQPGPDLTATLTLVDAAPGVHTAESGAIPAYTSQITKPSLLHAPVSAPTITQVVSDESVLIRQIDGALESRIVVSLAFASAAGVPATHVQAQYRRTGSTSPWIQLAAPITGMGMELAITGVQDGLAYDLQVRAVNGSTGQTSDWVTESAHTVVGKTTPPPAPTGLTLLNDRLVWSYAAPPPDFDGFLVRAHAGSQTVWETALRLHDGLVGASEFVPPGAYGTVTYLVKAVDVAGLESEDAAALTVTVGAIAITNNVAEANHRTLVWPGTVVNSGVLAGDLVANSVTVFWGPNANLFWGATGSASFWPADTFAEMSYTASYTPSSTYLRATLKVSLTVVAASWTVQYREDGGPWHAWPGAVFPIASVPYDIKVTTAGGAIRGVLSQMVIILDAPNLEEIVSGASISNSGTRLTLAQDYLAIKAVPLIIRGTAASAIKLEVADLDAVNGPLIYARNATNGLVSATVDGLIKGY